MRPRSNSVNFTGVVREILGTAQSVGCTIDHETPQVMRMMMMMTMNDDDDAGVAGEDR